MEFYSFLANALFFDHFVAAEDISLLVIHEFDLIVRFVITALFILFQDVYFAFFNVLPVGGAAESSMPQEVCETMIIVKYFHYVFLFNIKNADQLA